MVSPVLVGRSEIIEALDGRLLEIGAGTGGTVLVAGEAGQGNSRLAAEVRARANRRRYQALEGHCFEPDRALPFAPLLVRRLIVIYTVPGTHQIQGSDE